MTEALWFSPWLYMTAEGEAEDIDPPPNCPTCRTPIWPEETCPGHAH